MDGKQLDSMASKTLPYTETGTKPAGAVRVAVLGSIDTIAQKFLLVQTLQIRNVLECILPSRLLLI